MLASQLRRPAAERMNQVKVDSVSNGSQKLLSQTTKLAIINMIQHNAKPGVPYKLPNEGDLAATLGVSRNVLRDSLASLAEMGLVTRRRGRGTIANTDLANAKCRIDIDPEIFIAFRDSGYSPTIHSCNLAFVPEKDPVFNSKHAGYLLSEKIITANNMPAAYVKDRIVASILPSETESVAMLQSTSHFDFLSKFCNEPIIYSLSAVKAMLSEDWFNRAMGLSEPEPILLLDEIGYGYDYRVLLHSYIYYRSSLFDLRFLRKSWR